MSNDITRAKATDLLLSTSFLKSMDEVFPEWRDEFSSEKVTIEPEKLATLCQLFHANALNSQIENLSLFTKHQHDINEQ